MDLIREKGANVINVHHATEINPYINYPFLTLDKMRNYIDDVAFDRTVMKRVRKILERNRPEPLIDLHSANQFNPRDGYANSANLYLEHFPYLYRLWFGEYFDYNAPPS